MIEIIFGLLFFVILGIHLFGEYMKELRVRYLTKPLLMPLAVLYYATGAPISQINWLIIVALIFGCVGDIMLMFDDKKNFFMIGVFSFLLGHILYIIVFLGDAIKYGNYINFSWWGFFLIIPSILTMLYGLKHLKESFGEMFIPNMIYSSILLLMHLCSIARLSYTGGLGFWSVWVGSLLFLISDTILAWDKFKAKIPHGMIYIMITYALGQFLIANGMLYASFLR